ncbi:MAG: DNA alkylation repair protein [Luteolibacter sp.]
MALLEANRNERGVANWERLGEETEGLGSFGIGLTQLRKLAKQVGRDHGLALKLWEIENYDAKVLGLLIDDPKELTREQVERQVEGVGAGMLAHVFSSCDATLAKAPFVFGLACEWVESQDVIRKQCGYGLIYELSKKGRKKELSDEFFLGCIKRIRERFWDEDIAVRLGMGCALMGIGKRNVKLNQAALELAIELGPIDFNEGKKGCEPFDVVKHLTSDYLRGKLGL